MPDRSVVLAVVIGLLGIVAACVAAITVLVALNEKLPDVLAYLATTAVGAVAGILSRTTTEPQTVTVVQPAEKPVPVASTPLPADAGLTNAGLVVIVLAVLLAVALGVGVHPLFWLLLVVALVALLV